MRSCDSCGFDNAEPGKACPLCGASEVVTAASHLSTLVAPGQVLGDRYRVDTLLGSGGMGQVFRVTALPTDRSLALKVLRPVDGDDITSSPTTS
jgi:serine/threonine protein kinase